MHPDPHSKYVAAILVAAHLLVATQVSHLSTWWGFAAVVSRCGGTFYGRPSFSSSMSYRTTSSLPSCQSEPPVCHRVQRADCRAVL